MFVSAAEVKSLVKRMIIQTPPVNRPTMDEVLSEIKDSKDKRELLEQEIKGIIQSMYSL